MSEVQLRPKGARIQSLLDTMHRAYGPRAVRPYGDSRELDDVGFTIDGVAATFSVVILPSTPADHYDVQVESLPPGDYLYTAIVDLHGFESLVATVATTPSERWPANVW